MFSLTCDEYTDVFWKNQLALCMSWVNKELNPCEFFLGFF